MKISRNMKMFREIIDHILPSKLEQLILFIGGTVGAFLGWLTDGMPNAFNWLLVFLACDYITGMVQAFHNKKWSSRTGLKGLIKKVVILTLVILFHGISAMTDFPQLDTMVICAFCLNEMCSILENIERAGLGDILPKQVRVLLDIVDNKSGELIDKFNTTPK